MAGKRYNYVPADAWKYVGAGLIGLDKDVGDLESAVEALKSAASTGGATVTWASVMDKPSLATVATSGSYTDLTSRPTLAAVASSGAYTDLTGRPDLTGYAPKTNPSFTGTVTLTGTTVTGLTKATVGLDKVDNTADTSKSFAGSQITSGTVPPARLGTGTANSTTFLAGDGTWKTPSAGSVALAGLPAGSVISTTSATARPSTRTDLVCLWLGADPGTNALAGDVWMGS